MALTPAEKQKAYRERQKAEQKAAQDSTYPYLKETFSEFLEYEGNYSNVDIALSIAGIEAPLIEDERGPEEFTLNDVMHGVENPFQGASGAIGRAEVIIDSLIDAALEFAYVVRSYKQKEIKARLAELESSETTDRATAMAEAVKLNKILEQLDREVRRSFPQWRVTGI